MFFDVPQAVVGVDDELGRLIDLSFVPSPPHRVYQSIAAPTSDTGDAGDEVNDRALHASPRRPRDRRRTAFATGRPRVGQCQPRSLAPRSSAR
jgi:hypothetical protein